MKDLTVRLDYGELPEIFTCYGENVSPRIVYGPLDPAVKSLAVVAINPFEPGCTFTTWLICNIPPVVVVPPRIPKEKVIDLPFSAIQGMNDFGTIGYRGPCPKEGETHQITFKVYGLDSQLDLPGGFTKDELNAAMQGHVIQFGNTIAMYRR
ncbi:YbhB/YbcL family Raf kinase inhibitor-like protein [Methanosphaerula palustris]|uniref:PEBP family protein n=1 Tax=Methanosphaerula palustris (strain ATCC BAA-1556 / DSM 19958 / E1-9c) TaxID=521011 RepID=B8GHQ0_METPE|nr:YbhB/YbcL family Raf kinase inhibitor-like protein [Methanosphaerula palustris]ACL16655.1 PEBP family protein [Methanosphaerula palustris E1-9c]